MSILRRYYNDNQVYFVTNVTHERNEYLNRNYDLLQNAFDATQKKISFKLIAYIFLPEHFHVLIDTKNNNLSDILHRIKLSFGAYFRKRYKLKKQQIWQRRFWDHIIRNQNDFNKHFDYIHYNPVKHELVENPFSWRFSSIHEYKEKGYYQDDWGVNEEVVIFEEYGEKIE
jgi:putative transposase